MKTNRILSLGAVFAVAISAPLSAWAGHGKAGLWEIQERSNAAMFVVRLDWMSPEKKTRTSKDLLKRVFIKRVCATEEQANRPEELVFSTQSCKRGAAQITGRTTSIAMVCNGNLPPRLETTFDTPEHRLITVTRTVDPRDGLSMLSKYEMRWVSVGCGDIPPGSIRYAPPPPVTSH